MRHIKTLVYWKDVPGYEGYYQVNQFGKFRRILKSGKTKDKPCHKGNRGNYNYIRLHKDGNWEELQVHRIVAKAFLPNPDNLPEVDHVNNIASDNRVCNLQWISSEKNKKKRWLDEYLNKIKEYENKIKALGEIFP